MISPSRPARFQPARPAREAIREKPVEELFQFRVREPFALPIVVHSNGVFICVHLFAAHNAISPAGKSPAMEIEKLAVRNLRGAEETKWMA